MPTRSDEDRKHCFFDQVMDFLEDSVSNSTGIDQDYMVLGSLKVF
jgi:hypothetical protein